jgi:hypothetical protein
MGHHHNRIRLAALAACWLLAACVEVGPHPDSPTTEWPTGPTALPPTHLRGQVLDASSGSPVAGAKIEAVSQSGLSDPEGYYVLDGLRSGITVVLTTKVGYDTAQTIVPLEGGDKVLNVRLRMTTAGTLR